MTELATEQTRGRPRITDGRYFKDIPLEDKIERWERVTKVLRELSDHVIDKHFDMSYWMNVTSCGTTGCAAGQCALDPWFQRRGFGAKIDGKDWAWTGLLPEHFFGLTGYYNVFTNDDIISKGEDKGCYRKERKPRAQHRLALRAANQYLKSLKAQR